jgi:hypothetical protein
MKFGDKEFSFYWKIIKIPFFVLIGWSILSFIVSIISLSLYTSIFTSASSWILLVAVFGFIGWTAVKDHDGTVKVAAWSGALAGIISGFIGAIIGIIMFYVVPDLFLMQAQMAGADISAVQGFIAIGIYIGLITGPLISGLIGAAVSAIAALIAKKV